MSYKIIDVSEHQGVLDWYSLKPHIDGAIIRCGYGSDYAYQDDPQFARNVSECERLGIPYGVYLYSYAANDAMAESEAAHLLRLLPDPSRLSLPVYLDVEQAGCESYFKRACEVVGSKIEAAGYWFGFYAGRYNANKYGLASLPYTAWIAEYGAPLSYNGKADIWQYTSTEYIAGIGPLDCNECYRDFPDEIHGTPFGTQQGGSASQGSGGKSVAELAQEVIAGSWGNNPERAQRLTAAGYDAAAVQAEVDRIFGSGSGGSGNGATYTVQSGDTLSGIAQRFGIDYMSITAANGIADPNVIYAGQVLSVPTSGSSSSGNNGGSYTVVSGDTLSGIGAKLGVDWTAIATANGISSPYTIYPGQVLSIPGSGNAQGSRTYTVQSGDTLSGIGAKLGVDWNALAASNGIADPDVIYVGQVIRY